MELSLEVIIVLTISVMVLVVLAFFVNTQSSQQINTSNANSVFNTQCQAYKAKNCDWSVTREAGFSDFLSACRLLYGIDREAFSCLYTYCQACKVQSAGDLLCSHICDSAASPSASPSVHNAFCAQYASQCTGSCGAC